MESWVWVLIGFIGGIVVYAILNLIFAKDPSDEMEKLADERAAELAKAEMKTAVLQDKLVEAETERDEQRDKSEAECQQKLREADAECQQKLREADAECQQKLAAAEASYREKLDVVEQQFANLETAFAQQAAEMGAALTAAGLAAGAAASPEDTYLEELDQEFESEEEDLFATDDPDLLDASLSAAAAAAVLAGDDREEEIFQSTAKPYDEPLESYEAYGAEFDETEEQDEENAAALEDESSESDEAFEADLDESGEGDAEADADLELAEIEAEVAAIEDEDEGAGRAAIAAASVAAASALSNDDEEEASAAGEEEMDYFAEADEFEEESPAMAAEPVAFAEDDAHLDDAEDAQAGVAAAAAVTAAAAVAAAGDDEEAGEVSGESAVEDVEEVEAVEEMEAAGDEDGEQPESFDDLAGAAAEMPDLSKDDEIAAGIAAVGLASAVENDDSVETDEETVVEMEDEAGEAAVEEEALETVWPEDKSVWTGEYFNNMKLEGEPVLVREDAEIDFDWEMGSPAPEISEDGFSVRWTRTADLPPGLYRFTVTSDDGARLWVNGRLVISAWYDHTEMTFRREIELPGGPVELQMEYYENEMAALVRVIWERIG